MAPLGHDLRLCSFNCRSIRNSLIEVQQLCMRHDIVLLQEHWLLPHDLQFLSQVHCDFLAFGTSAVDISKDVLIGRPYGGTAILYRKEMARLINIVKCDDSRMTAVRVQTLYGPLLIVNVYMPTDYHDDDSLELYTETCGKLNALLVECDVAHVVIAGDFNCNVGTRFFSCFDNLATSNSLIFSDINRMHDVFTYCGANNSRFSWIDHVLSSKTIDDSIHSVDVLYDFILSDHKPLSVLFLHLLTIDSTAGVDGSTCNQSVFIPQWDQLDSCHATLYTAELDRLLQRVICSAELQSCILCPTSCSNSCRSVEHHSAIDKYYDNIMACVSSATRSTVPVSRVRVGSDFIVPGWSDYVQDKHTIARSAYLDWVWSNKPRVGPQFVLMQRTRASFKLALRYCRQHEAQCRADACAHSLKNKDPIKFWRSVHKISNSKATKYATIVDNAVGETEIANMWMRHFELLYSSVPCDNDANEFFDKFNGMSDSQLPIVTVNDVYAALAKQKKGKSPGPDGIYMEALLHAGLRLVVHLTLLFNLFLSHCHLPLAFMESMIVPLVKNKGGDLTDVDNYRAIALSNCVTKILESIILCYVSDCAISSDLQFGFKVGHSTSLCTYAVKETIDYYTNRGSQVFACFVDFSKAFDKVNYWKMFKMLLADGVPRGIVGLLVFWYSNQLVNVRWHNTVSRSFHIGNGTRQGGILSPCLFSRYIHDLLLSISGTKCGCNIGGTYVNIFAYADDIVLLAPSWHALQLLLSVLESEAVSIDMMCNIRKTVCMVFAPKCRNRTVATRFPPFKLFGNELQYVESFKYLGHIIDNTLSDSSDIEREIRNLFMRANILLRRFGQCSVAVKVALFKAYCICFYGHALWRNHTVDVLRKLKSCYHKCIKIFFGFSRQHSITDILLNLSLPSFETVLHNGRCTLQLQIASCANSIIVMLKGRRAGLTV